LGDADFPGRASWNRRDAETLDTFDSTDFLRAGSKAADTDLLDGQDSTAIASASHNHDSSYIQQSPGTAENASINITGTMRTSGMLRTGSETGTSQPPVVFGGNSTTGSSSGASSARTGMQDR